MDSFSTRKSRKELFFLPFPSLLYSTPLLRSTLIEQIFEQELYLPHSSDRPRRKKKRRDRSHEKGRKERGKRGGGCLFCADGLKKRKIFLPSSLPWPQRFHSVEIKELATFPQRSQSFLSFLRIREIEPESGSENRPTHNRGRFVEIRPSDELRETRSVRPSQYLRRRRRWEVGGGERGTDN